MGKAAHTASTGKGGKPNGKKQLNAALPEQLVLDFNVAATEQGRDALLEELLLNYLATTRPDSPPVRTFRRRAAAASAPDAAAEPERLNEEREALRRVRQHGEELVALAT